MRTVSTDFRLTLEDQREIRDFVEECRRLFGYRTKLVNTSIHITTASTRKTST
jgi:hypothetical protein